MAKPEDKGLSEETGGVGPHVGRRGLFAAGAAFLGMFVGKLSVQPVEAGVDGDLVLGASNTTTATTTLTKSNDSFNFYVNTVGSSGVSIHSTAQYIGVSGACSGTPVFQGAGVYGAGAGISAGVWGDNSNGNGVLGTSLASTGVRGEIPYGSFNAIAVMAVNNASYAGPAPGAGGFGIYGSSAKGHGLVGATGTAGGAAVVGATNGVPGAYAAAFYGPVVVGGAFTVVGGPKSAAVPFPDGVHRRLYCEEAPESWFADYGRGTLADGRALVTIDPRFAIVADLSDYHVFVTPRGETTGLMVVDQTPIGFAVREQSGGRNCLDFSWRIVAKRKDIEAGRFETVEIPPPPTLPEITPAPRPPTLPRLARE